ncbi:MAG TPA: hypothetical protein PLT70_02650 [bacterium]|nr:hypothetical protein [bacterium]
MINLFKQLSNKRNLFYLTVILTLAVTVFRAIRLPNNYSKSHWLIDYRFGFMKRGIIGSICSVATSFTGTKMTPGVITILSGIVFVLFVSLFLYAAFMLLKKHGGSNSIMLIILVFSSSPFFVMSAHLFGYFDAVLYICAILSILLIEKKHYIMSAFISSFAILVHESYFLTGLTLVYFSIWLKYISGTDSKIGKKEIFIMLIPFCTFIFLTFYGIFIVDNKLLNRQLFQYLKSIDFVYVGNRGVPHWQTIGMVELFKTQKTNLMERIFSFESLSAFYPVLIAILSFIYSAFKLKVLKKESIALLAVVLAPLAIHSIAFDTVRISLYTTGSVFIAFWILSLNKTPVRPSGSITIIALSVLILNIFSKVQLMGKELDRFTHLQRAGLYLPALLFALFIIFLDSSEEYE